MTNGFIRRIRALARVRPSSYRDAVRAHLPLALAAGAALLWPVAGGRLLSEAILCPFFALTGSPCPLCGFTRSFHALLHGGWLEAWGNCPLAVAAFVLVLLVIIWNLTGLILGARLERGPLLRPSLRQFRLWFGLSVSAIGANWVYRLAMGFH